MTNTDPPPSDPKAAQAEARQTALAALTAHRERVQKAEQQVAAIKAETVHLVAACRVHGPTRKPLADWRAIADALGQKQPNVHTKYAPLIEEAGGTVRVKPNPKETS